MSRPSIWPLRNEADMPQARARIVVSGRVQGVFFRYTMCREAEQRQVNGWVRNRCDGLVEAVVEGDKEKVEDLISWCHQGPPEAAVRNVDVGWQEWQGKFKYFFIKG